MGFETNVTLNIGIVLALLCAFASNLSFLYKHRGACSACDVDIRHPLRTARSLWSQRWFAVGMFVGLLARVLHVGAISLAPLSVVQVVLSSGLVLLAVMADRLFGFKVGKPAVGRPRRIDLSSGSCCSAITLPASHGAHSGFSGAGDGRLPGRPLGLSARCSS